MISFDTNVLLYAYDSHCPEHAAAKDVLQSLSRSSAVLLCELVLVELYLLLRSPAVVRNPVGATEAAAVCGRYRRHPRWRLVESAPVMSDVWRLAANAAFARRRIIDARLALTLRHHGVTEVVTRNVKDFQGFGFERIRDPFEETGAPRPAR